MPAIKPEDIVPGAKFELMNKPHLEGGANMIYMGEGCHYFDGAGELPPGTRITIASDLDNREVRTAKSVSFTIDEDETQTVYSTFYMFLKPRAKKCQ